MSTGIFILRESLEHVTNIHIKAMYNLIMITKNVGGGAFLIIIILPYIQIRTSKKIR